LRVAGLFVPVWWAWTGFTWYATGFDNDDDTYRVMMLGAMLAVLALSVGIDGVRHGRVAGFVLPYAFMQGLLSLLFLRSRRHATIERGFTTAYALGYGLGGALWLASVWTPEVARVPMWVLGMVVLMLTPMFAARRMPVERFDAGHIAERYGSFTLIVLGESVVAVAAGTALGGMNSGSVLAGVAGFGIAACVWWIYFEFIRASSLTRDDLVPAFVWGYGHLFIFAGIAAAASGVQRAVTAAAAGHALTAMDRAIVAVGMIATLAAMAAIHGVTVRRGDLVVVARLAAVLAIAVLALLGGGMSAPAFMVASLACVGGEAVFEIARARRGA
jgi:low temperature requirement protein LtrA